MSKLTEDYKSDLIRDLKEPSFRAAYLRSAIRESRETFLLALRDIAEAAGGGKAALHEVPDALEGRKG